MSLAIDTNNVGRVLLADGWHDVSNQSFDIDSYEFIWGAQLVHGGGQSGICASGFGFKGPDGEVICGPLTSIIAVSVVT